MKFGVVIFPGSNCDKDLIDVLDNLSNGNVVELWHKDTNLKGTDFVFLPGGFSYGDYLRSGAIANLSPIMSSVIAHAKNGGYVMGICNGFQILCESLLLPGALLRNNNLSFVCTNVFIKPETNNSIITRNLNLNNALQVPIAHGEGRFYADNETIKSIQENDQILFKYTNQNGETTAESNPNGSLMNIAGICNKERNVFGMMPHPERCYMDYLLNTDGKKIFKSIVA